MQWGKPEGEQKHPVRVYVYVCVCVFVCARMRAHVLELGYVAACRAQRLLVQVDRQRLYADVVDVVGLVEHDDALLLQLAGHHLVRGGRAVGVYGRGSRAEVGNGAGSSGAVDAVAFLRRGNHMRRPIVSSAADFFSFQTRPRPPGRPWMCW